MERLQYKSIRAYIVVLLKLETKTLLGEKALPFDDTLHCPLIHSMTDFNFGIETQNNKNKIIWKNVKQPSTNTKIQDKIRVQKLKYNLKR